MPISFCSPSGRNDQSQMKLHNETRRLLADRTKLRANIITISEFPWKDCTHVVHRRSKWIVASRLDSSSLSSFLVDCFFHSPKQKFEKNNNKFTHTHTRSSLSRKPSTLTLFILFLSPSPSFCPPSIEFQDKRKQLITLFNDNDQGNFKLFFSNKSRVCPLFSTPPITSQPPLHIQIWFGSTFWLIIITKWFNFDDFQRLVHFRIIQCVWIMFFHLLSLLLRRKQIYSSSTSYLSIIGHKHFPTEPPSHPYLSGSLHFTPQTSRYLTFILSKRKSFRCLARFYDAFHLVTIFCWMKVKANVFDAEENKIETRRCRPLTQHQAPDISRRQ